MGGGGGGSLSLGSLVVEEGLMSEEGHITRGILLVNPVLFFLSIKKKAGKANYFQQSRGVGWE